MMGCLLHVSLVGHHAVHVLILNLGVFVTVKETHAATNHVVRYARRNVS